MWGGLAKKPYLAVLTSRPSVLWETVLWEADVLAVLPCPYSTHTPELHSTTGCRTLVEKGQAGQGCTWQHQGSLSAAGLGVGRSHVEPLLFTLVINSETDNKY